MLIEYNHVNIYQQDTVILKDVNFGIDKGEFAYIIGKVGSGKSSLLKSLYCELDLYSEDCEKAEILGRNLLTLRRKDVPELRRHLGIIFQDFQLLHDRSVYQNLLFVLKATGWKDKAKVEAQQRIVVARAMLNHPDIIIADEPTGNLDPETAEYIVRLLKDITLTGTAVIMSTHNIPMLDKFPGIVYRCHDGSVKDVTSEYNSMDLSEDAQTTD